MIGYPAEADFDLAKEQRQDRVKWAIVGGGILLAVYRSFKPFSVVFFQWFCLTVGCFGLNFYAARRDYLNKLWLWRAIFATIPLHLLFLVALFWSDRTFPQVMTKAIVFFPILVVALAIESALIDSIVKRFKPPTTNEGQS